MCKDFLVRFWRNCNPKFEKWENTKKVVSFP